MRLPIFISDHENDMSCSAGLFLLGSRPWYQEPAIACQSRFQVS